MQIHWLAAIYSALTFIGQVLQTFLFSPPIAADIAAAKPAKAHKLRLKASCKYDHDLGPDNCGVDTFCGLLLSVV